MTATRTFVGFGFGPIQSGLFLYEAWLTGSFKRFVVAEVDDQLVKAVRENHGRYHVNIARKDRIDQVTVEGVELYNPRDSAGRSAIIAAIAEADEMATCLPSVAFFDSGNESSVAEMLTEGLKERLRTGSQQLTEAARATVIYAAENHNHAAEILLEKVQQKWVGSADSKINGLGHIQFLNTVIGKMSGVITERADIVRYNLATVTPTTPRAVLVEEFNCILISRIALPNFERGIRVFIEKDDLLPFEEAKLYGHNAIHALIGYLAEQKHLPNMAEAGNDPKIMQIARRAFIEESGAALIKRHAALGDPLFTPEGYRAYAEDLLDRMIRPNLNDLISRVCRDPIRKLGYDDRLFGTMRLALKYGIEPSNLAFGSAAAVLYLVANPPPSGPQATDAAKALHLPRSGEELSEQNVRELLFSIWQGQSGPESADLCRLTWTGIKMLRDWLRN